MGVVEFIFISGTPCEVYCHTCGQLRLWCKPEKPTRCGNCASDRIDIDRVNSPQLAAMRFGERLPRE